MSKEKEIPKKGKMVKGFATGIIIFFLLAIFIWTLDPNMRDEVWSYIKGGTSFITVDGKNILTAGQLKQVIESREINFRQYPDSLIIQFFKNFQEINELINKEVLLSYSTDIGLELSPEAKQLYALELYKKAKEEFETKNNIRFRVPLENFFTYAEEQYLSSIVNSAITQGILITKSEAEMKFIIENTKRQVEYAIYNYDSFFKKLQFKASELKEFFEGAEASSFRANLRNRFRATAIFGANKEEMTKLLEKVKTTAGLFEEEAKKQNAKAQDYIITPAIIELLPVRSVNVGDYSPIIQRGNIYYIYKIIKHYPREFDTLTVEDLKNLREEYAKNPSSKNKYQAVFQEEVKKTFNEIKTAVKNGASLQTEAQKRGLEFGITEFFPIAVKDTVDTNIKDPINNIQKKPINLFDSGNNEFFDAAFKLKKNNISEMLNKGYDYYIIKYVNDQVPGTMDAQTYKKYAESLTKRNQEEIRARVLRELHNKYKVVWHENNIIKLVRALQGRSG